MAQIHDHEECPAFCGYCETDGHEAPKPGSTAAVIAGSGMSPEEWVDYHGGNGQSTTDPTHGAQ